MSKSRQWKMFVFVLIGIICFSSCAEVKRVIGPERYKRMVSAFKKLDQSVANAYKSMGLDDSDRTRVEAGGLGAIVGALIGQASGRDTKSTVIGAAIGAIAGFAAGDAVAKRKIQYAKREEKIAKEVERTGTLVNEIQHINQNLKRKISQLDHETQNIKRQSKTWSAYKKNLNKQRDKIKNEVAAAMIIHQGLINEVIVAEKVYNDAKANRIASKSQLEDWERKISDLNRAEKKLVKYIEELSTRGDKIIVD